MIYPCNVSGIQGWAGVIATIGLVDLDFCIPSSYQAQQPNIANVLLPKQNEAESETAKLNTNPIQLHDHLPNPVYS